MARRERKVVTVLFADLAGFTSRAESRALLQLAPALSRRLQPGFSHSMSFKRDASSLRRYPVRDSARTDVTVRRALQVYLYAVCFVTVIVVLFAGSQSIYALVRVAAPGTTAPSSGGPEILRGSGSGSFGFERPSRIAANTTTERNEGKLQLIQNGILLVLALGIFLIHWNRAAALRAELERATTAPEAIPVEPESPPEA